jgi:CRP-like cAMP-binding protein
MSQQQNLDVNVDHQDGFFENFSSFGNNNGTQAPDEEEREEIPELKNQFPRKFSAGQIAGLRRGSVSAEPVDPSQLDHAKRVVIPKDEGARHRIHGAIKKNLLFRNLEEDQRNEVIDAMFEKRVKDGETVIKQGEEGDNFYVVDSGCFEVLVDGSKVVEIAQGGSFGELALMYNAPRAATVKATADSVLWATDRETFRRILTGNMFRKRRMYENFLKSVPILTTLSDMEVTKIADALEPVEFDDGTAIVTQGESGDNFYILVEGRAKACIIKDGESHEMAQYGNGDYFGEIALIHDSPRAASVYSVGRSKCVVLNRAAFIRLMGSIMDVLKRNIDSYKKYEEYDK